MIISVASGKGGTGKTTIATNLALNLLEDLQFLDCDVEEPNAALFLYPLVTSSYNFKVMVPKIDLEKCSFCGACAQICHYNALAVLPAKVLIFPELCHSCGGCALICPVKAIKEAERTVGKLEKGLVENPVFKHTFEFWQGISDIQEPNPTPLIKALLNKIDRTKLTIIDSPPGAGCPMVTAVKSSDYCLLVTEPTPFGLSDLAIALEVVQKLRLKAGVVINKAGEGDELIEDFCCRHQIPVLEKFPLDKNIAVSYSCGMPFSLEFTPYRKNFTAIYEKILQQVSHEKNMYS